MTARRALSVLALLLLWAGIAGVCGCAPVARAMEPASRSGVEPLADGADFVRLAWRAARGDGRSSVRVALPPGRVARVACEAAPAEAVSVGQEGFIGRMPFAEIVLDADALPPGARAERVVDIRFVAGRPSDATPPAVLDDARLFARAPPVPAAWSGPEPAAQASPGGGEGETAAWARRAGLINADDAPAFLAAALADPAARPPAPARLERGSLRRVAPRAAATPGASEGSGSAGRVGAGRLDGRAATGFENGRVKIVVAPDDGSDRGGAGIYRITGAQLAALGIDLSAVPTADLRLVTHGFQPTSSLADEVALRVEDGGDGRLDAADFIEFWGEPVLGEAVPRGWQGLDYTDVNVYVLDAAPGARRRMVTRDASPVSPPAADYLETAHAERDDIFVGNHRTGQYNVDHYYWCGLPALEWQTGDAPVERVETIAAEGLNAASSRPAELRVRLLARTSGDHASEVDLGSTRVSSRTSTGYVVENHVASGLPAASLQPGANDVTIRLPGTAGSLDRFELDWIELDYPRAFTARSGRLDFRHEGGASVRVAGLGPAEPTALDLTNPLEPVRLTGLVAAGSDWVFELGSAPARHAVAGLAAPAPTAVEWMPDAGLSDPSFAFDVVVVGPRAWLEPPLPALARWVADRQAQGLSVLLAPVEDVIDEFNDGVFSPVAVGWMLVEAFATWQRPPRHVLFLGDTTFDYKNLLDGRALQVSGTTACQDIADPCVQDERAWCQHVPTRVFDVPIDTQFLSYYASDVILALVAGSDWVPDVAIGRVPARSAAEAETLLDKVLSYEAQRAAPPAWASRVATCADQMAVGEEAMEQSQDDAIAATLAPAYPRQTYYYQSDYIDQGRGTRTAFRDDLLQRDWPSVTEGYGLISYVGHGNAFRWSSAALLTNRNGLPPNCEDDAALVEGSHVPGGPVPFVANTNCITASFIAQLGPGLIEAMVRQPNAGFIAGIGPTGITDLAHADDVMSSFYGATLGPDGRGLRAGDILLAVQSTLSRDALFDATQLLNTALLGDPTLGLVVPHGPPAGALRATGADQRVDLEWDAAVGAGAGTTYDAWRSTSATGPWTRIASGLTGLTHADVASPPTTPDPQNGQRYWYAVEPFSADGWPGRWSNRADARPCTQDPPEPPSNLAVSGPACGTSLTATYAASPTPFLQGYRVRLHLGTSAGPVVASSQPAGTFTAFGSLIPFATYTVTVSALSWCNVESAPVERSAQITCPAVLGPPAWIPDLRVRRAGADVVLDWPAVTQNARGEPITPALYRVYRADAPDFLADPSRELAPVALPGATDAARVGAGPALEFYAVAAETAAGERGAVGHDYPQGVRQTTKTDAGADWSVSWTRVTHDLHGEYTPIASYLVYARTRAFTDRSDIAGLTPVRVSGPPALIPKTDGDYHLVVPEDVHGNQSVY